MLRVHPCAGGLTVAASLIAAVPSVAQDAERRFDLNVSGMTVEDALLAVARVTGRQIVVESAGAARRPAKPLIGRFSADEAIATLLEGTALDAVAAGDRVIVHTADEPETQELRGAPSDIVVTGSRIRGASQSAPLVVADRAQMIAAGQTDLGEVARSIPQNFTGGQNPGVGTGAENFGSENVNSATSLDLRGLGPDATLTLLNGRRLAYNAVSEGVDISAIPPAAVERLEIVADGASALYGSDAVAGVANIILRRDLNGLEARARLAAATEGGFVQDQYEAAAGTTWSTGAVMGAASFNRNTAVRAGQRSVASTIDPSSTLYPAMRHVGGVLSGHWSPLASLDFGLDALASHRRSFSATANLPTASVRENGATRQPVTRSVFLSPEATVELGSWLVTAHASYGRDVTILDTRYFVANAETTRFTGRYRNRSQSAELSGEGPIIALPGGTMRAALGAGLRSIHLAANQRAGSQLRFDIRQGRDSSYLFGELRLPLFGQGNARPGVERLELNAAGRYERYPSLGDVFTPKLALVYSPIAGFDLRGSWGKSFKAPTLYQQYQSQFALLFPARFFGGDPRNTVATAIFLYGGNRELEPQRATNWSVGVALRPSPVPGFALEASYFRTRYRNRIAAPILSAGRALSDPALADLVAFAPSASAVAAAIAASDGGFNNLTGRAFDPAQVVAIIDNRNLNVAEQRVHGIDILGQWAVPLTGRGKLVLSANGTWLESERRLSAGQPLVKLAGQVFNPPQFRGRAGLSFTSGGFSAASFVSRTGSLVDGRFGTNDAVEGQTIVDFSLGYRLTDGPVRGLSVQLTANNLFNAKPDRLRTAAIFETPYDSTNFSPLGRVVGVTLGQSW